MEARINGIRLNWQDIGDGPPLLFIHGFPLSGALWHPLITPLSPHYRLIIPDLRGMGASSGTAEATMAVFADDLAGLLDQLNEQRPVVLVGLSMGGYIAFECFRRHRSRLRGLVLADTRAEADSAEVAQNREETAQKVLKEGSHIVVDAMLPKLFAASAPPKLIDEWRQIMAGTPRAGVAAALRAMARRQDSTETLPSIDVPTLIVVGEEDAITPPADARRMHQGIPGSVLKTISHAGHMTPVESPGQFARILSEFLMGISPPP